MRCVYTDYTHLYNAYPHIIVPLANSLKAAARHFYRDVEIAGHAISDLAYPPNEVLIDEVVISTVSDLDRIKKYHPVDRPTRYKYGAYIGFWWQRVKPFACKFRDYSDFPGLHDNLLNSPSMELCRSLNELFITDQMLSFIQIPSPAARQCANQSGTFAYADIKDSLHYFLRYRQYTAQELELFLKGLATCPLAI